MAIPLLLIGCMQCGAGSVIVMRASKDISRVEYQLVHETQKIKYEELPRMEKVLDNFTLYKYFELVFIVIGLLLFLLFFNSVQTFWKGIGLGLLLPALILFVLDLVAEKRAKQYVNFLLEAF
ncbi:MAG: hypothetical protein K0S26_2578 [Bacteroidota bacterium]|nr:hypothetical protein [Bacteroidota bacterium]